MALPSDSPVKPRNLLLTVHGYAGDAHQIRDMLPYYEHHGCPLVIFSPEDSRIESMGPHSCRFGGKRAYTGPDALARQKTHMRMMLEYPFEFFLANDSDSFCITPEIPAYLFEGKGILWSNEVSDMVHHREGPYEFPRLALQPPYFFSREVIEKLLSAEVELDAKTPFMDWAMMAWAVVSGCPHKNFRDGHSCGTGDAPGEAAMADQVRHQGKVMLHSIKTLGILDNMLKCREDFLKCSPTTPQ